MKLLIALEDAILARHASSHLSSCGHDVTVAADVDDALELLASGLPPSVMLVGGSCARVSLLLATCAELPPARRPYVILHGQGLDADDPLGHAAADVDDFLVGSCSGREMEARVRLATRIMALESQAASARDWLVFAATHDAVTGALTRSAGLDALDRELARAARETSSVGIAAIEVRGAIAIRDEHGTVAYDLLLQGIACRVRDALRTYDILARASAESLFAVLPGVDASSAESVASRLRDCIDGTPFDVHVASVSVTCAIAITTAVGDADDESTALLARAEASIPAVIDAARLPSRPRLRASIRVRGSAYPTIRVKRGLLS